MVLILASHLLSEVMVLCVQMDLDLQIHIIHKEIIKIIEIIRIIRIMKAMHQMLRNRLTYG